MSDVYVDSIRPRDADVISLHASLSSNKSLRVPELRFPDGRTQKGAAESYVPGMSAFTSSGTFNVPAGIPRIRVQVEGGGGTGGGGGYRCGYRSRYHHYGGAGGVGGWSMKSITVTEGDAYTVIVGGAGGNSRFYGPGGATTVNMYGNGGGTGGGNNRAGSGGDGGTSSGGDLNVRGDTGHTGQGCSDQGVSHTRGNAGKISHGSGDGYGGTVTGGSGAVLVEW